ncbi:MAG TPA: ATP-dependent DNA ligase [Acidimicrobiales bacterium]|nr:ATP-dependent DNA ligase [Acidimicrobiales bacterium]
MKLPVMPPVSPMLAKAVKGLPPEGEYLYEPKWDGFRTIIFRDGDEVELGSRNEKPMTRYFPDMVDAALNELPERCVIDGEVVIAGPNGRLEFETLQQRIHPAASRVNRLAAETPASFVAFDLLCLGDEDLRGEPFSARRALLEKALGQVEPPIHLTPATADRALAADWFDRFEGAGLDGVIAKPTAVAYRPGERAMLKIKHERTADCVVAGFRWHKSGGVVGSLLLGLYDDSGNLNHVGVTAAFTMARRKELVDEIAAYRMDSLEGHPWSSWGGEAGAHSARMPGAPSRWSGTRSHEFEALRPELVVEVAYDHMEGSRFRHATHFRRWRKEREPESCTYEQLDVPVPSVLEDIFGA